MCFAKEPLNNKLFILVKHVIQAFFSEYRAYPYSNMPFCWLTASFSVKEQTSPLIYVVKSFRPAIASKYKFAQANRAYKRFSFFFNPR